MICLLLAFGVHQLYIRVKPYLLGTGCAVRTAEGNLSLDVDQAANAATIAAVGLGEDLPRRAVTIALATAFQETHLRNLPYGDRDSVGLFQQRPSQGWGKADRLLDPVFASRKFYRSLRQVPGYLDLPLHEAAQRVQRSADGTAYAQHEERAVLLTGALTGRFPAALHCWFPEQPPERTDVALTELRRAFRVTASNGGEVIVPDERNGWVAATWMVTHALEYGIGGVRYRDHVWEADRGHDGWRRADRRTPVTIVRIL